MMKTTFYQFALPITIFVLHFFSGSTTLLNAQAGDSSITYSIIKLEPCRYRLFVNNTSPDCFNSATLLLQAGYYTGFTANGADGWVVEQLSPTELLLTHSNGLFPQGSTRAVDFTFFEPGGTDPTFSVLYPNLCLMESYAADFLLEACPGGCVSGTVYRECKLQPFSTQQELPDWTVQVLDGNGTVVANTATAIDGTYSICDLPPGQYFIKAINPGNWTASLPPNGQWPLNVSAAGNYSRDFGFCPKCSCDSLNLSVWQASTQSDTGTYYVLIDQYDLFCFPNFTLNVEGGEIVSFDTLIPNWEAEQMGTNALRFGIRGCYPVCHWYVCQRLVAQPLQFQVAGTGNRTATVTAYYDTGAGPVGCTRKFVYPPSSEAPCCPAGNVPGPELVVNGDFEAGNTGFNSGHTFKATGPLAAGQYTVASTSQVPSFNNQWACTDHTSGSPTGKMLLVDGSKNPPAITQVWHQNVPVTAGKTYTFSAWVNNLVIPSENYNDPQVELYIDGKAVAGIVLPESPDQWYRMCVQWTAPATGVEAFELRIGRFDNEGNDFAIDDISVRACEPAPCQADFAVNFIDQCGHVQLVNTSTGVAPISPLWNDGSSSQTLDLQLPCGSYTYCLSITDGSGCMSDICKTFTVSDNVPPVAKCVPGFGVDLDANCQFQLTAASIDGGSTDNCQIQSMSVSPNLLTGCGNTPVTLTVRDWCGNTSTCTTGIQTLEVVPPTIKCPDDITAQGNPALGGVQIQLPLPDILTDNCGLDGYTTDPENGLFPCGSATLVTYTAKDICGNTATCEMSVVVEDCEPVSTDTCCAFALHFVNKYTDGRIKYVRVTGLCDTKICCTDPDEWAQTSQYPYNIIWKPADGSPVPFGNAINNDFLIYLSEAGLNSFQIEWIDQNEIVIARHVINIACDGMYDEEDEDWTQYTSTTGLDDPNLFVFAVREDSEDGESDCEPEEKAANICPFGSTVTCIGPPNYQVSLQGPSGYSSYIWTVVKGPSYPSIGGGQNPSFTGIPGSYVITLLADDGNGNACTGEEEVIIADVNPDFTWKFEDCPNNMGAQFTASGLDDVSSISWSSTSGAVSPCCSNPVLINFPAQATYTVSLSATDIYGCLHTVSHPVTVDLSCKAGLEVEKFVFCPTDCAGVNTKDVTVTFGNLSTGGKCPITYKWDFGDGNTNTVTNKNDVPHTYKVPCPGGKQYSVTLTMTDADNVTCTETIIADITPCEVDFSYIICPDGKVIFEGNHKGKWSFPGSHSIAPWPYSDIKDSDGNRKKVVVRYDQSGVYTVSFTGVCDNGGECTIVKEFFIMLECCAKNDRKKGTSYFSGTSGGQFKMKYRFAQNQLPFFHHIKAKTRLKKQKTKFGITYWKNNKADEIESSFLGLVYKRDADKCNCKVPFTIPNTSSGVISAKKAKAKYSFYLTRFRSRYHTLTSTHYAKKEGGSDTKQLQLGEDCDKFRWWLDWF